MILVFLRDFLMPYMVNQGFYIGLKHLLIGPVYIIGLLLE